MLKGVDLKAHPGRLSYGSPGNGTSNHLSMEYFKSLTGAQILHVPYRGAGPSMQDLMGGQIEVMGHVHHGPALGVERAEQLEHRIRETLAPLQQRLVVIDPEPGADDKVIGIQGPPGEADTRGEVVQILFRQRTGPVDDGAHATAGRIDHRRVKLRLLPVLRLIEIGLLDADLELLQLRLRPDHTGEGVRPGVEDRVALLDAGQTAERMRVANAVGVRFDGDRVEPVCRETEVLVYAIGIDAQTDMGPQQFRRPWGGILQGLAQQRPVPFPFPRPGGRPHRARRTRGAGSPRHRPREG